MIEQNLIALFLYVVVFCAVALPIKKASGIWRGLAAIVIMELLFQIWGSIVDEVLTNMLGVITYRYLTRFKYYGMALFLFDFCLAAFSLLLFIRPVLREDKGYCSKLELAIKLVIAVLTPASIFGVLIQLEGTAIVSDEKGLVGYLLTIVIFITFLYLYFFTEKYFRQVEKQREYEKMEQFRMEQLEYYQTKMISEDKLRKLSHDMNKYYAAFQELKKEAPEEVEGYIDELFHSMEETVRPFETGNTLVDTILMEKEKRAKENEVSFDVSIQTKRLSNFKSVYLCSVFANALDNALESCMRQEKNRFIRVDITKAGDGVYVLIQNPYQEINVVKGQIKTVKEDTFLHGLGLKNIENAVDKCGGDVSIHMGNGVFSLGILLNGNDNVPDGQRGLNS